MPMTPHFVTPSSYPISIDIPILWGEMDSFGHVNNIHYIRWCEAVRMKYMAALELTFHFKGTSIAPILARTEIDYFIPLKSPDTVTVCMSVTQLGNTSFTSHYRIISQKEGKLAAQSQAVLVLMDYHSGQKVQLDEVVRSKILKLEGHL